MKHAYKYLNFLLLSALIALGTACSSSSGGDDGGGGGAGGVPANAVLIDNSPVAEATASSAIATGLTVTLLTGIEATPALTARDIINTILETIHNNRQSSISIVTGVDLTADLCVISGTASGEQTETATTFHLEVVFNACDNGGFILDGDLLVDETFAATSGPYTESVSGNLTVTIPSVLSFTLSNLDYKTNGNDSGSNGEYTITSFDFTYDIDAGGGYLVELTANIVGNEFSSPCEATGGQILITGAAGSQARVTINSDGTMTIEYHNGDGNFVETDNSPILCLI